jgi:hypothetical protein
LLRGYNRGFGRLLFGAPKCFAEIIFVEAKHIRVASTLYAKPRREAPQEFRRKKMFKAKLIMIGAWSAIVLYVIAILFVGTCGVYVILWTKHRIEDKGLKSIAERIWNGKEAAQDKSAVQHTTNKAEH